MKHLTAGLSQLAAVKFKAASLAAMLSFSLSELTTGQLVVSGFLAALSAVFAAYLASRPAMLNAKTEAKKLDDTEAQQLSLREDRIHEREVAFLQRRIEYNSQVAALTRVSKHNVLDYSQKMDAYLRKLAEMLKACGREVPPFEFKYYADLCGDEDRALAKLAPPVEADR